MKTTELQLAFENPLRGTHYAAAFGLYPLRFQLCCFFTLPYLTLTCVDDSHISQQPEWYFVPPLLIAVSCASAGEKLPRSCPGPINKMTNACQIVGAFDEPNRPQPWPVCR